VIIDWPLIGVWRENSLAVFYFLAFIVLFTALRAMFVLPFFISDLFRCLVFDGISNGELFGGCKHKNRNVSPR
jgi:hypothetical protein